MCAICGCDGAEHEHEHEHGHPTHGDGNQHAGGHRHADGHGHSADGHGHGEERATRTLTLEADLLAKNDRLAAENRAWLDARGIAAFNLMGAPGAGKTALLEQLLRRLRPHVPVAVLEGDQDTDRDAERVRATGVPVVQINTGAGCHLDAHMTQHGLEELRPAQRSLLFVENVGNLVCPALFDLGERAKVVVLSVTEGDDKPLKYPHMFRAAQVLVVNKIDLLEHVDFDVDRACQHARSLAPDVRVFLVSARRGDGLDELAAWLRSEVRAPEADDEETELRRDGERIDELLDELASMAGPQAFQRIEELVARMLRVYGAGLARVLAHARDAGAPSPALDARLCGDALVSGLLRVHGLHPLPTGDRVRGALEDARAELAREGVALTDHSVDGTEVRLRLAPIAAGIGCGSSTTRVSTMIEQTVHAAAPEVTAIAIEGLDGPAERLVQIDLSRSARR